MTEFELISRLIPWLHTNPTVVAGAGDDCAILDLGMLDGLLLLKTDAIVEGVHFTREAGPDKIGHKALARCLSDVAAMAGTPSHALVTIGLPKDFDPAFVEAIYVGLNRLAKRYDVAVAGGETTLNPERIFISVSVLGKVARGKYVLRSGAKPCDAIFVTGELGGSLSGKHLEFEPRVAEGRWLAEHFAIHSMIDVSDGLAGDLRHLLGTRELGAELLASAIPISRAARNKSKGIRIDAGDGVLSAHAAGSKPALLAALTDGEDFELLFTVASQDAVTLLDAWRRHFPELRLSCIGKILSEPGVFLKDKEGVRSLVAHGYVHFA
ncbi:MAG: thiamine-phosphate kinase [Verrucomicrobia bacterium]|nr:thiamine-phosphate kinase [Verrucomicrobiota bacterium]